MKKKSTLLVKNNPFDGTVIITNKNACDIYNALSHQLQESESNICNAGALAQGLLEFYWHSSGTDEQSLLKSMDRIIKRRRRIINLRIRLRTTLDFVFHIIEKLIP